MGSWGVKALESDNGLDVIDFMVDQYNGRKEISLKELLKDLREEGLLNAERDDIDYLFDSTAIVVAELVIQFKEMGKLNLQANEEEDFGLDEVESFEMDKTSLQDVVQHLKDINNERPDQDGDREYAILKRESKTAVEWNKHLKTLLDQLKDLI